MLVVAAIIQREDRKLLIGQRRKRDTSALKWEFPGGKVMPQESNEAALARELREELGVTLLRCVELARVHHNYPDRPDELEIRFYAAAIADGPVVAMAFEQIAWVLPRELGNYDFLSANATLVANLATGRLKPLEILEAAN